MRKAVPILNQGNVVSGSALEVTVDRLADYLDRNNNLVFPHRHDFYQCVLFTGGEGYHIIDFEQFQVEPWQMYFMAPAQIHIWSFGQDVEGYVINFGIQSFQTILLRSDILNQFSFFSGHVKEAVFVVDPTIRRSVSDIFGHMLDNRDDLDFCKISLLYLFKILATRHIAHPELSETSYNTRLLANFLTLIEDHYKTLRLPKDFASLLYITPNHLNALCKEHIGISAGEVIRNRVLLEAKRLLSIRDLTVLQVSNALNFNDNSYFSKFFKKLEGISPEEFRNNLWKKL